MVEPRIDIADNTYTRGRTTDISERRKWGRLLGYTSNTVGKHYLLLVMCEPRDKMEFALREHERVFGKIAEESRSGIRLHAGQVKQLLNFLNKWLDCHYKIINKRGAK